MLTTTALCLVLAAPLPAVQFVTQPVSPLNAQIDVPWRQAGAPLFDKDSPQLMSLIDPSGDPRAQVYASLDANNLYLHVAVHDDMQVNERRGSALWDGDSIQVSIDARGDGAHGLATRTDLCDRDDAYIAFGLGTQGPEAYAHRRGLPAAPGAWCVKPQIRRDEATATTVYDLTLPWRELMTSPLVSGRVGLALQVNDTDQTGEQKHVNWGGGPPGSFTPGRFITLRLGAPDGDFVFLEPSRDVVTGPDDPAEATLVSRTSVPMQVRAVAQGQTYEFSLSPSPAIQRLLVRLRRPAGKAASQVKITAQAGKQKAELTMRPRDVSEDIKTLQKRLTDALGAGPPAILAHHFRSLQALFDIAWADAMVRRDTFETRAIEVAAAARTLSDALANGASAWPSYLKGQRDLVLGFTSPLDQTFQVYSVRLPQNFEAQPDRMAAVVFLHGKGDKDVLDFAVKAVAEHPTDALDAVLIAPFARGNEGINAFAEADVGDAVEDAKERLRIDDERVGLMGFSMGGAGAWSMALHAPERWSGVAVMAGGTWLTSLGVGLGANARGLPMYIWHGDADRIVYVAEAHKMEDELHAAGVTPEVSIAKGIGHEFLPEARRKAIAWLMAQRRGPLDEFTYVADDFMHRGRNGVLMRRDAALAPFPRLHVQVGKGTVNLETMGVSGLDVDLGPFGLNMQGPVEVFWNKTKVYEGLPRSIILGDGAGRR